MKRKHIKLINTVDPNTVFYCGRKSSKPKNITAEQDWSILGNPYPVEKHGREEAIDRFKIDLWKDIKRKGKLYKACLSLNEKSKTQDINLFCFCKEEENCHCDVIISACIYLKGAVLSESTQAGLDIIKRAYKNLNVQEMDIFNLPSGYANYICITTNGFYTKKGAVMGRGCAAQYAKINQEAKQSLGEKLHKFGNRPVVIGDHRGVPVVSFPVKPQYGRPEDAVEHMKEKFEGQETIPGWAVKADPDIILDSFERLFEFAEKFHAKHGKHPVFALPLPGCGAGELSILDLEKVFDKFISLHPGYEGDIRRMFKFHDLKQ